RPRRRGRFGREAIDHRRARRRLARLLARVRRRYGLALALDCGGALEGFVDAAHRTVALLPNIQRNSEKRRGRRRTANMARSPATNGSARTGSAACAAAAGGSIV